MTIKTAAYDAADYLKSPADIEAYLEAALEQDDPSFFQKALGTVARAKGMKEVAHNARTTRAGLYKALAADGNPEFATVYRVVKSLGYRLELVSEQAKAPKRSRPAAATKRAVASKRKTGRPTVAAAKKARV